MSSSKKEIRMMSKKRKLQAMLTLCDDEKDIITMDEKRRRKEVSVSDEHISDNIQESQSNDALTLSAEKNKSTGGGSSLILTAEEIKDLKARINERQKASMGSAKLFLTVDKLTPGGCLGNDLSVTDSDNHLVDAAGNNQSLLFLKNLRHLLLYAIQGPLASERPRWCTLLRPAKLSRVFLCLIDGVSSEDYTQHREDFPFISEAFSMLVEMANPNQYGRTIAGELFEVPLSQRKLNIARKSGDNLPINNNTELGQTETEPSQTRIVQGQTQTERRQTPISRIDLLLNDEDMEEEGFPLLSRVSDKMKHYVGTKDKDDYRKPTKSSPLFGLDCEMVECMTKDKEKGQNELAWIAITDESGKCVLEELVKPRNQVVDYRTWVSGISKVTLKGVKTRIETIQKRIRELLPPDAILVGQSLNGDLHAMQMFHPYVIDTSVIYNLKGHPRRKTKLKVLAKQFLNRDIQDSNQGHNPLEDAQAALDLVHLKLKHGLEFGNVLWGWNEISLLAPGASNKEMPITNGCQTGCQTPISNGSNHTATLSNGTVISTSTGNTTNKVSVAANDGKQKECSASGTSSYPAYRDFFELAREQHKSVAVGGFGDTLPPSLCTVKLNADTDRQLVTQCRTALANNFMVCTRFDACSNVASEEDEAVCNKALRLKADKRCRKVMKSIDPSALCVVVMADSKRNNNVVCHLKIT